MRLVSRIVRRANLAASTLLSRFFVSNPDAHPLERLGSDYGGWVIPTDLLGAGSICYCAGVGEDITFDLELIRRFGCDVYAFDPTPRSAGYVAKMAGENPKYHFFPVGLWSERKTMRFFAPRDPSHVSHSIVNLQGTKDYFEAPCERLTAIMEANGHGRLNLLKMDIEGAEWAVLRTILEDRPDIRVLCVEFDQPCAFWRVAGMILALRRAGYRLCRAERWNYSFIRNGEDRALS